MEIRGIKINKLEDKIFSDFSSLTRTDFPNLYCNELTSRFSDTLWSISNAMNSCLLWIECAFLLEQECLCFLCLFSASWLKGRNCVFILVIESNIPIYLCIWLLQDKKCWKYLQVTTDLIDNNDDFVRSAKSFPNYFWKKLTFNFLRPTTLN